MPLGKVTEELAEKLRRAVGKRGIVVCTNDWRRLSPPAEPYFWSD